MTTLRDALTESFEQSEAGTLGTPAETTINAEPSQEAAALTGETQDEREARLRDGRGRFAKAEDKPQGQQKTAPAASTGPRKPPSSWKKDYWQHWEKIGTNPELAPLQDYLEQREAEYSKGVSTYKSQWDQVAPVHEAMQQFMPELQRHNISPAQWITNLGSAHRALALGNPEQKLQMFAKLAVDYGIPLQALLQGGRVDPQNVQLMQTVSQLSQKMNSWESQQKQTEDAALQQHVREFAKDKPHFEALRPTMARLLESGVVTDLKSAYEKAIRLDDDIWQQEQASQADRQRQERQQELDRKRRAAASPRSSSPTGPVTQGGAKKGLRDQLSDAFETVESGRF